MRPSGCSSYVASMALSACLMGCTAEVASSQPGEDSAAVESDDNNSDSSSDWDDGWATGSSGKKDRGRGRSRTESGGTDRLGREIVTAQSLFKSAKEEGKCAVSNCKVKALTF